MLLSSVTVLPAATWGQMIQEALTGQPVAVSTDPAATAPATATAANQSLLEQIRANIPSLIANIKILAPKAIELASKTAEGGFFSGITAAVTMDPAVRNAAVSLYSQITTVTSSAQTLLNNADPATKATVKGLLAQVVQVPEFQTLMSHIKNFPIIGGQIEGYLATLQQAAQ